MISLNDRVSLEIEVGTLATLLVGLYCTASFVDPMAIPTSIYIELCEKLVPYLTEWDYEKMTFEHWVQHCLLIIPKAMCSDEDIKEFQDNDIYFERANGNAILIVTAEMIK